jgi:hypothetical protein
MKGYDIPIFWHTDETRNAEDAGLDVDFSQCIERILCFYSICAIAPYENNQYCKIWVYGESFVSPLSYTEVKLLLDS